MKTGKGIQINKSILTALISLFVIFLAAAFMSFSVYAADSGIPDDYEGLVNGPPHTKMRDVFTTETINVSGIRVVEVQKDTGGNILTDEEGRYLTKDLEGTVNFRIFNTTTQETEFDGLVETVRDEDGRSYLPALDLKKNHDYIFFVEDSRYQYPRGTSYPSASKTYVQVRPGDTVTATEGPGAYNYLVNSLKYNKIEEIVVEARETEISDPFEDNRYDTDGTITVKYKGNARAGVRFRLVSDVETLETSTGNGGNFSVRMIEGVTYMVYVDSDKYSIDPFPLVVKDKTEYGEGLYCYNHSTCVKVDTINLYDIGDTEFDGLSRNTTVDSLKGRSTVTGMNFKNLLIVDRLLDDTVDGLSGSYEVISISAVNPTRWEISKLLGTDFGITWKECKGRLVSHVYTSDEEGRLNEIAFSQTSADNVSFRTDSLSLYPVVIEYDSSKTYADKMAEEQAARDRAAAEQAARERAAAEQARIADWEGTLDTSLPAPKISKPKAAKKSLTAKWKKLTKKQLKKAGSIRIEVQYSLDGSFPMDQTERKFTSKKKASLKIKSLAKKQTYYVRVRTYKEVGGIKYVSKWSKTRKIKVK